MQYPGVSFIFIYRATKKSLFKEINTHEHEIDVIIEVGKRVAKAIGRFKGVGKMSMAEKY